MEPATEKFKDLNDFELAIRFLRLKADHDRFVDSFKRTFASQKRPEYSRPLQRAMDVAVIPTQFATSVFMVAPGVVRTIMVGIGSVAAAVGLSAFGASGFKRAMQVRASAPRVNVREMIMVADGDRTAGDALDCADELLTRLDVEVNAGDLELQLNEVSGLARQVIAERVQDDKFAANRFNKALVEVGSLGLERPLA